MYKQIALGQLCEKHTIKYLPLNTQPFIEPNHIQSSGCDLLDALGCLSQCSLFRDVPAASGTFSACR